MPPAIAGSLDASIVVAPACPLCPLHQQLFFDYNADDLAENIQWRRCEGLGLDQVFVTDWAGKLLLYEANCSGSCQEASTGSVVSLENVSFLNDTNEELLLRRFTKSGEEQFVIYGLNRSNGLLEPLELVSFAEDLGGVSKKLVSSSFENLLEENKGFSLKVSTEAGETYSVEYLQDALDGKFYPLKIEQEAKLSFDSII